MRDDNKSSLATDPVLETTAHSCKNCGNEFTGKYCNRCGEKAVDPHERSIMHFVEGTFHTLTHADGKIFRNLNLMIKSPGLLSKKFAEGGRQRYMKPISMFFVANLIYFLFPPFNTFTAPLYSQRTQQFYSQNIRPVIDKTLTEKNIPYATFEQQYNVKTKTLSKLLLILFVPMCAILFMLLNFKRERYFADHLLMGMEFMSYTLFFSTIFWGFLLKGAAFVAARVGKDLGFLLNQEYILMTPVIVALSLYFLIRAEKLFYRQKTIFAIAKAIVFVAAYPLMLIAYRFLLFFVTIETL